MAPTETIKWTAVPNGLDSSGNNFQLSVLISPELKGGATGTLADFPDFQDWPAALANAASAGGEWLVEFSPSNNSFHQTIAVPFSSAGLNSTLWKTLFPKSVVYGPPEPIQDKFRNVAVASYPAQHVTGFLQGQYTQYSLTEIPSLEKLKEVYGPISDVLVGRTGQALMHQLAADRRARSKGGTVPHANDFTGATPAEAFAAQAFYHMPPAGSPPAPGFQEAIDFHRALTFIGQHGVLQRALGLVFDLLIPVSAVRLITSTLSSDVFVSASLDSPQGGALFSPGYSAVTPRTHLDASKTVFQAHATTSDIDGRQLAVGDPASFVVHIMDFDRAGLRASNFATQIQLLQAPATINPTYVAAALPPDPATPIAPPSIRSNGLTLTHVNRGVAFANSLARAFLLFDAVIQSNPVPDLNAEDLVRGYVLDVLDTANNKWRSTGEWLCTYKAGSQTVTGPTSPPFSESSTQAPPRVQNSPTDENDQQANLSEVILRYTGWSNAVPRPGTVLADADSQLPTDGPFKQLTITVHAPPGRLPPLRFGHTYQLRARIVDVCNNVLPVDTTTSNSQQATDPTLYGRHEPIGSPDVHSQSVPRLAESLKRLVIRDIDGAAASSLRALAPQRCAEPFAEWHSMFDTGTGGAIDGSKPTYDEIVGRESAEYPDPPSDPKVAPTPIALTSPVPYLPDPLAKGGVLTYMVTGATTFTGTTFDFSGGGDWPNYRPFGLRLVPGNAPPQSPVQTAKVDNTKRLITFALTQADTLTVNLASTCDPKDISLFALADFGLQKFSADDAAAGKYWSITPPVQLELVYAVQRPLLAPEFPNLPAPPRQAGDTFAPLVGDLSYSPKSTSKVDLLASWGEPVDDPVNKLPVQGPGAPNPNLRLTTNSPVATLPSDTSPLQNAGSQLYSATDRFSARHEFYDTKHRNVTYQAVATSRFSEFYDPGTNVTKSSAHPVLVNIPSSARPDTPKIAYVVPIYGWQLSHPSAKTTVSARSPSALRVFIERPWWSSGIDELLGVVTWPGAEPGPIFIPFLAKDVRSRKHSHHNLVFGGGGATTAIPADQAPYMTDWGADPVFGSSPLPSLHPRVSSFSRATQSGFGLSIEEQPGTAVNVAGHPVGFDASRNLWYCDIAVNTGSAYTPMIRLALARFQPNSVPGVELSRIVLADIMSLEPGRTATVVRKSSHELASVTLTGFSYSRAAGTRGLAPGEAEVVIERRQKAVHDPTLGWEQVGDPIRMSHHAGRDGTTSWLARNVKLPKGTVRLCVNQYEVLPSDNRSPATGFYPLARQGRELRLLYQDLIPL